VRNILLALAIAGCHPQVAPAPPPNDFQADLDVLQTIVTTLHPGVARYLTEAQLRARFAESRARLGNTSDVGQAFLELTALTAAFECGHSYPNFSNQPKDLAAALFHARRLPFLFRWIAGEMVVTDSFTDAVPVGARVVAIGGRTTASLLAALMPYARADGSNDAKRSAYLEDRGDGPIEAFDVLASLRFPELFAGADVELQVGMQKIRVPLVSYADHARAVAAGHSEPAKDAPLWTSRRIDRDGKRFVYLAMPTWVAYKTSWDWRGDLDRLAESLVRDHVDGFVDLRGNEGGNDIGDALLAHVIAAPLAPRKMSRRVRFASVPQELRPYLDTWDLSFFELGKDARPLGGGWYELSDPDDATIAPKPPRFTGKLIVLVDAANSSATFQFAQTVRDNKLGLLVGTPTGGSQRGINGGAFFFARLPHSHIEVDVPLIGTFPPAAVPDQGIQPDVLVETTADAIAAHRDPVLEVALERAR